MTGATGARLRVVHIIQNLNWGGMERLVADLVRLADRAAFDSHVLVMQYAGRFAAGLEQYGTVHQADPLPRWSLLWPGPLIRQLRRLAPDVVHSHSGVWYKASLAARRAGVPRIVHTAHGLPSTDAWYARLIERLAARRTDTIVAVSEVLARHLAATVARGAAVRVVPNGVDTARHHPSRDDGVLRGEFGLAADVPIIGSVGRLEPVKAYELMIEALARLRASWPATGAPAPVLIVAGDGAERDRLRQLATARGVGDVVHLLGWRDDLAALHGAFTLYSLSSRSEGTSVSLLEAMSAGLCPVVTDVGGNGAVLGEGLRHRLVTPGDPAALAAAWAQALRDPQARATDARAARARVEAHFSLQRMVRTYEAIYRGDGLDPRP